MYTKTIFFILFISSQLISQEIHKCGLLDSSRVQNELSIRGNHWGYGYEDLLSDLDTWSNNKYISIDSIGKSVQNRVLWELRISADEIDQGKHIIYIHVRTHPNEVQSFWVAKEMISLLISDTDLALKIRANCVFYIIPMYNPDGVELEYPRENANNIDIESNWYSSNIQQEVKVLKSRFEELMSSDSPIEIALNLHSAYKCKRYFVYHHENGTSFDYSLIEKEFINYVVSYFPTGFQPWNFIVTWSNGTPKKYPESWWWLNYGKDVLALTYEDGNCDEAGDYDKTANAIISGIGNYFGITPHLSLQKNEFDNDYVLEQIFPNPVSNFDEINIKFNIPFKQNVKLELFDQYGKMMSTLYIGEISNGSIPLSISNLKAGVYFYRLMTKNTILTKSFIKI